MRPELFAMARSFRAVAACRHVTPAATTVLRVVEEDALAASVGAAANPRELAEDECIGGGFDNGDHESGKGVADGDEGANERAVVTQLDAACAGAATEHAIDLGKAVGAYAFAGGTTLGERAQCAADAPCIDKCGGCASGLLLCATSNAGSAFRVEDDRRLEPTDERFEIAQCVVSADAEFAIHEIEPESFADEHEGRAFQRWPRYACERDRGGF